MIDVRLKKIDKDFLDKKTASIGLQSLFLSSIIYYLLSKNRENEKFKRPKLIIGSGFLSNVRNFF